MTTSMALTVLTVLALAGSVPPARAVSGAGAQPVALRPRWHRVLPAVEPNSVAAGHRYLVAGVGKRTVLLDVLTHRLTRLRAPRCSSLGGATFGGPWLAFICETPLDAAGVPYDLAPDDVVPAVAELYDLASRAWHSVALDPATCDLSQMVCSLYAVGADWMRIRLIPAFCTEHCIQEPELQNITTGAVVPDLPAPGSADDLDSPSGVQPECVAAPYTQPFLDEDAADGEQPIWVPLGAFALIPSYDGDEDLGPTAIELARCGERHPLVLESARMARDDAYTALVASPSVVLLARTGADKLNTGVLLPSLRRFSLAGFIGIPAAIVGRTLYSYRGGGLWAAVIPDR